MNGTEAVLELRRALDQTQPEFAKTAQISFRSLCRYEGGYRLSAKALKKFAEIAKEKKLDYLYNIFNAMREGEIALRVKQAPSTRSRVRLAIVDVSRWARTQSELFWQIERILSGNMNWDQARELLKAIAGQMEAMRDQMAPYLTLADFEQAQLLRQFNAATLQRMTPHGRLDLTGAALRPNVEAVATDTGVTLRVKVPRTPSKKPRHK
jgi:transcriptional regulator with XRE-family HTH domain